MPFISYVSPKKRNIKRNFGVYSTAWDDISAINRVALNQLSPKLLAINQATYTYYDSVKKQFEGKSFIYGAYNSFMPAAVYKYGTDVLGVLDTNTATSTGNINSTLLAWNQGYSIANSYGVDYSVRMISPEGVIWADYLESGQTARARGFIQNVFQPAVAADFVAANAITDLTLGNLNNVLAGRLVLDYVRNSNIKALTLAPNDWPTTYGLEIKTISDFIKYRTGKQFGIIFTGSPFSTTPQLSFTSDQLERIIRAVEVENLYCFLPLINDLVSSNSLSVFGGLLKKYAGW